MTLAVDQSDIPDPIGGPREYYDQCAALINTHLTQRVAQLEL